MTPSTPIRPRTPSSAPAASRSFNSQQLNLVTPTNSPPGSPSGQASSSYAPKETPPTPVCVRSAGRRRRLRKTIAINLDSATAQNGRISSRLMKQAESIFAEDKRSPQGSQGSPKRKKSEGMPLSQSPSKVQRTEYKAVAQPQIVGFSYSGRPIQRGEGYGIEDFLFDAYGEKFEFMSQLKGGAKGNTSVYGVRVNNGQYVPRIIVKTLKLSKRVNSPKVIKRMAQQEHKNIRAAGFESYFWNSHFTMPYFAGPTLEQFFAAALISMSSLEQGISFLEVLERKLTKVVKNYHETSAKNNKDNKSGVHCDIHPGNFKAIADKDGPLEEAKFVLLDYGSAVLEGEEVQDIDMNAKFVSQTVKESFDPEAERQFDFDSVNNIIDYFADKVAQKFIKPKPSKIKSSKANVKNKEEKDFSKPDMTASNREKQRVKVSFSALKQMSLLSSAHKVDGGASSFADETHSLLASGVM